MKDLLEISWPLNRLGEALDQMAGKSHLGKHTDGNHAPSQVSPSLDLEAIFPWLQVTAGSLGLEIEQTEITYAGLESALYDTGPCILPDGNSGRFFAVLQSRRKLKLLGPDLSVRTFQPGEIFAFLRKKIEEPFLDQVQKLTQNIGGSRRDLVCQTILQEKLRDHPIAVCWHVRLPAGASFWKQLRAANIPLNIFGLVGVYALSYALMILSWVVLGKGLWSGQTDPSILMTWGLFMAASMPLSALTTWISGVLAIRTGKIFKRRILQGILHLEPEEIRCEGPGRLLGRAMEIDAVATLAINGGFTMILSGVDLIGAAYVMHSGTGSFIHFFILLIWIVFLAAIFYGYFRRRIEWTDVRFQMTNHLVERMVGYRTRLAQEPFEKWHLEEDHELQQYLELSQAIDRRSALLSSLMSRGWYIVGIASLTPWFIASPAGSGLFAVGIGGIFLANRALAKINGAFSNFAGAAIAWRRISLMFQAAGRPVVQGMPDAALIPTQCEESSPKNVIEACKVAFSYPSRSTPVLQNCNLTIQTRDRILLEGPSGGGKSTLNGILTGLRLPKEGLLFLRGLDYPTMGSEIWRKHVVSAPQFHENHVLTGTFAYNLLMGRRWPARPQDLAEAAVVCEELGLGPLLRRMPGGLMQMVGESGWQLSHGERSRLYIGRAVLQKAGLVIFDESFAALDPENLRISIQCVLERCPTLMVIAHP